MKDDTQSFTAEASAVVRAAGTFEKSLSLKNPDTLAIRMIRPRFRLVLSLGPFRRLLLKYAERKFPGLYEGHLSRTHYYDRCVSRALDRGIRQLVILGAGFDSRPYRLATAATGCRVFEVDHPATSRAKQARISALGLDNRHVTYVPVDFLREKAWDCLAANGFDYGKPTLFTWEGVTMYLDRETVAGMMAFLASLPTGSGMVFDYFFRDVITNPDKFEEARIHLDYVEKIQEPYTFGINPQDMAGFVSGFGLTLAENLVPEELNRQFLSGHHRGVNAWYGIAYAIHAAKAEKET